VPHIKLICFPFNSSFCANPAQTHGVESLTGLTWELCVERGLQALSHNFVPSPHYSLFVTSSFILVHTYNWAWFEASIQPLAAMTYIFLLNPSCSNENIKWKHSQVASPTYYPHPLRCSLVSAGIPAAKFECFSTAMSYIKTNTVEYTPISSHWQTPFVIRRLHSLHTQPWDHVFWRLFGDMSTLCLYSFKFSLSKETELFGTVVNTTVAVFTSSIERIASIPSAISGNQQQLWTFYTK